MGAVIRPAPIPSGAARATGADAGFTLIEVLVSIAILAVLAVGASLTMVRSSATNSDAQRFSDAYRSAQHLAVMGQSPRGIVITPRGSHSATRPDQDWVVARHQIPWRGHVAYVPKGGFGAPDDPEIVFLPNGQTTAFSISFGGASPSRCASDGWTGLICDAR